MISRSQKSGCSFVISECQVALKSGIKFGNLTGHLKLVLLIRRGEAELRTTSDATQT